jgi:hypothetical protein
MLSIYMLVGRTKVCLLERENMERNVSTGVLASLVFLAFLYILLAVCYIMSAHMGNFISETRRSPVEMELDDTVTRWPTTYSTDGVFSDRTGLEEQSPIPQPVVQGTDASSGVPLVESSVVLGTVIMDAKLYAEYTLRNAIGMLQQGDSVEIIRDKVHQLYYVRTRTSPKTEGWVHISVLEIEDDPPTDNSLMTKAEIEDYVSCEGLDSLTDYLVWVDLARQVVHVLSRDAGDWSLLRTMTCATGRNVSPTIRGTFAVQNRGKWFYSEQFGSGGENWVRFYGPYMFHSVPMDKDRNIIDSTLGRRASAGCIRLSLADSLWFYETMPQDTTVYVN